MNCDHVFDLLTQVAPAPVGAADDLEAHLAGCSHCRRLANSIQPAVGLLREPSWRNTCQASDLASGGPWMSSRVAARPAGAVSDPPTEAGADTKTCAKGNPRRLSALAALAAAVVVGLAIGGAWTSSDSPDNSANSAGNGVTAATLLQRLGATPACLAQATNDVAAVVCCTRCHASRGPGKTPAAATARVALSCQLCHAQ